MQNWSQDLYNFIAFNVKYNHYYFDNIKIEKGTKATDWSPAPEDIDGAINAANANSANAIAQANNALNTAAAAAQVTSFLQTTAQGNVVATGTLLVGDVLGGNAGVSGVTDKPNRESVRFWTGADYALSLIHI